MSRRERRDYGEPFGFAWWLSLFVGYLLFIVVGMGLYIFLSPDRRPDYTPYLTESATEYDAGITNVPDVTDSPSETARPTVPGGTNAGSNIETDPIPQAPGSDSELSTDASTEPVTTPVNTGSIRLVSLTSPVNPNGTAEITIQGTAGVVYDIDVFYSTTASSAKGLTPTAADRDGQASWSWKVGASVKPGEYRIEIRGGGETFTTYFTVE